MPARRFAPLLPNPRLLFRSLNPSPAMPPAAAAAAAHLTTSADPDEDICSRPAAAAAPASEDEVAPPPPAPLPPPPASAEERVERAWAHWRRLGAPRLVVAPMVDNSELPFRMLCRRYGASLGATSDGGARAAARCLRRRAAPSGLAGPHPLARSSTTLFPSLFLPCPLMLRASQCCYQQRAAVLPEFQSSAPSGQRRCSHREAAVPPSVTGSGCCCQGEAAVLPLVRGGAAMEGSGAGRANFLR